MTIEDFLRLLLRNLLLLVVVTVVGAAVSAAVEAYQFSLPARNSDPMDVLANTVGAALGVALGLAVHRAAVRRHQAAVRPVSARADA